MYSVPMENCLSKPNWEYIHMFYGANGSHMPCRPVWELDGCYWAIGKGGLKGHGRPVPLLSCSALLSLREHNRYADLGELRDWSS